jgi:uncharacterized protein (TIGR00661 family)
MLAHGIPLPLRRRGIGAPPFGGRTAIKILYGVIGEGLGHATRSRVVAEHLIRQGHQVKAAASGRAYPYLEQFLPDVEEIWGLEFALEHGQVAKWDTLTKNVRGGLRGVPGDWHRGVALARKFGPDLVVTDFEGFAYLFAKTHRLPVISVDNIQMVDRCRHDPAVLTGFKRDYLASRAFISAKLPRANHYVITTFFWPPTRKERTSLVPSLLRNEVLAATREPGEHLLVYGRISETAVAALEASGVPARIYGGRDGVTADESEGNLLYRPFANEAFVDDLRTCRGVVASAGYSLMSEAVYLRKPMLALPLTGQFEQEMNSRYLAQLGFGTASAALDEPALEQFLEQEPQLTETLSDYHQDGNRVALETIDRLIAELAA